MRDLMLALFGPNPVSVGVVDRIEEPYAVIEAPDGAMVDVPLADLPLDIDEGDLVAWPVAPPKPIARRRRLNPVSTRAQGPIASRSNP